MMVVDRTYLTAGIVIMIGIVLMAMAVAMILAISPNYWNDVAYGTVEDYIKDGKQADLYGALFDVGLMVVFIGIAIIAFGLATARPEPIQYRPVETMIPPQQYPPQQYPPKP